MPVARGVYVLEGTPCENPANAAFRVYDGQGISGSATCDCRIEPIATDGDVHEVDQSCVSTYNGERTSIRQTIEVRGREAFTLTSPHGASRLRLCEGLDPADFTAAQTPG